MPEPLVLLTSLTLNWEEFRIVRCFESFVNCRDSAIEVSGAQEELGRVNDGTAPAGRPRRRLQGFVFTPRTIVVKGDLLLLTALTILKTMPGKYRSVHDIRLVGKSMKPTKARSWQLGYLCP